MRWILLDLVIALAALALLAVLVLRLWRRVKALSATVRTAGDTIATATDALAAAQAQGPLGGVQSAGPSAPPYGAPARSPSSRTSPGRPPAGSPSDRLRSPRGA